MGLIPHRELLFRFRFYEAPTKKRMRALIEDIVRQLNDIQESKNWVGTNFAARLNSITENEAFVRPLPNLHSVAEIVSHLTAWRKDTIVKIRTGTGKMTVESEENWLDYDTLQKIGWDAIKADYQNSLTELIELLRVRDDEFLRQEYYDPDFKGYYPYQFVVDGMLHHDIYHLGQIGIVIKLLRERGDL